MDQPSSEPTVPIVCPRWQPFSDLSELEQTDLLAHLKICLVCRKHYAGTIESAEASSQGRITSREPHSLSQRDEEFPAIPGFRVERWIANGGQGIVYRATDLALQRSVAIKHLKWERLSNERDKQRLLREAKLVAGLDHPNIVRVYTASEEAGIPYIVMEYLRGGTLSLRRRLNPLTPTEAANLIRKLALAVQFAHDQHLVHRDIKPSNILFADDTLDTPKLADFGLAKSIRAENADVTPNGIVVGTPHYVAPEVIRNPDQISPKSDVYSLGATLYLLLTGQVPFAGATDFEALLQATSSAPIPPRVLVPSLPEPLERICLHSLSGLPETRYASMQAFADDLTAFLRHEPISLQPLRWDQRVGRAVREHWKALSAVGLLAVFVALVWYGVSQQSLDSSPPVAEHPQLAEFLREDNLNRAMTMAEVLRNDSTVSAQSLRQLLSELPASSISRRNATLYFAPEDATAARELASSFLAANPDDFDAWEFGFRSHKEVLAPHLWDALLDEQPTGTTHLRAYKTLLVWEQESNNWDRHITKLTQRFLETSLMPGVEAPPVPHSPRLVEQLVDAVHAPATSESVRQRIIRQLVAGCRSNVPIREELHRVLSLKVQRADTYSQARECGSILARLFLADHVDVVRPYVMNEADPTMASIILGQLVTRSRPEQLDAYLRLVAGETDPRMRRWLLSAVCQIRCPPSRLQPTTLQQVRDLHQSDPDAGVHAATELLLLRWNRFDLARLNREKLRRSPYSLNESTVEPQWYIGPERTTMCRIPDPRSKHATHFAIAMHETSKLQFEHYMRTQLWHVPVSVKLSGVPVVSIPLHHIRGYCNWLSAQDGFEPCYRINPSTGEYESYPDMLNRTGYRLPTETEWKTACQSSAETRFFFGRFPEQIEVFGNCKLPAQEPSTLGYVCRYLPNSNGLFDVYGNASELCEDPKTGQTLICGGSNRDSVEDAHTMATRYGTLPGADQRVGFRVAQTLPAKREP